MDEENERWERYFIAVLPEAMTLSMEAVKRADDAMKAGQLAQAAVEMAAFMADHMLKMWERQADTLTDSTGS